MTMGTRIVVMKDGYVQQIDAPQKLYDEPNNLFVAGFIGTPPMNFFYNVKLVREGKKMFALFGEAKLPIPEERAAQVKDQIV